MVTETFFLPRPLAGLLRRHFFSLVLGRASGVGFSGAAAEWRAASTPKRKKSNPLPPMRLELEARVGIEPTMQLLQSRALPLGYPAVLLARDK